MKQQSNIFKAFFCSLLLFTAVGCATIEGAGEDVESAGEAIQDAADNE